MRWAIGLQYNGSSFHGWQFQKHTSTTVQQSVEHALSTIANHPVKVVAAGRTDTGVHAFEQVIHFDTSSERNQRAWVLGSNALLPNSIRLQWAVQVPDEFHARFSVIRREYCYLIFNSPRQTALWQPLITWNRLPLNCEAMQQCLNYLIGTHDFSSFQGAGCQAKSAVRRIEYASIEKKAEWIRLRICANGFLLHMVRNIVGTLLRVGEGDRDEQWFKQVFAAKDRRLAGKTADPSGLYLSKIDYPEALLPAESLPPRPPFDAIIF